MPTEDEDKPADRIKDSAQQIWLAGLGAFAKMQQEGSKAFEALVKDGAGVQKKTQQAAEETLAQAQARMAGFASEFGTKAAGGWGKLENIFEERVARALAKLGVPSAEEVESLHTRVAALESQLNRKDKVRKSSTAARKATGIKPPRRPPSQRSSSDD
ncbi:phasin family protein [Variovorax saccharolyticus]|uniref:phasin family protein n=1 Tax=Variovorax saccharolyticus TaxID=3053516 RepID=UPI0025751C64|nr:phasin family protein [Variovorax sp. J31P216]MDM0028667.1 phasin family protein [Variovorax sp. J31P216]